MPAEDGGGGSDGLVAAGKGVHLMLPYRQQLLENC